MSRLILVDRHSSRVEGRDPRFRVVDNNSTPYFIPVVQQQCGRRKLLHLRPQSATHNPNCCQPGYLEKLGQPDGYSFVSKDYPYHKIYINTKIPKYNLGIDPKDNYF
jgi:hypothetical protein